MDPPKHDPEGMGGALMSMTPLYGIRSIHEGGGSLDDLHPVYRILVHLKPMVCTPLLAFVLDAVFNYDYLF